MPNLTDLRIKLFADGADLPTIRRLADRSYIRGFTTNPTLMRKAAVEDYVAFAREFLAVVPDRHISFEVFSDEPDEMERQALEIASWGPNVYVKIPVTNTRAEFTGEILRRLVQQRVQVNVTAILTVDQVQRVAECLSPDVASCVSVFAGRIADTGVDPVPIMARAVEIVQHLSRAEIIWASPRELLNVVQADEVGCHIITATADVLGKLKLIGKDLTEYSLDTVKMFRGDAIAAGYSIITTTSVERAGVMQATIQGELR
jgi:transaldolase